MLHLADSIGGTPLTGPASNCQIGSDRETTAQTSRIAHGTELPQLQMQALKHVFEAHSAKNYKQAVLPAHT
jgi:hypothetical protein